MSYETQLLFYKETLKHRNKNRCFYYKAEKFPVWLAPES